MAMEKEALTNTIESDLARRNRNWDKIDDHLADYASLLEGGEIYQATLLNGWTGSLKFSKNALGYGHLRGQISPGTTADYTAVASLPPEFQTNMAHLVAGYNNTKGTLSTGLVIQSSQIFVRSGTGLSQGDVIRISHIYKI